MIECPVCYAIPRQLPIPCCPAGRGAFPYHNLFINADKVTDADTMNNVPCCPAGKGAIPYHNLFINADEVTEADKLNTPTCRPHPLPTMQVQSAPLSHMQVLSESA